jgi:hypothetical protein
MAFTSVTKKLYKIDPRPDFYLGRYFSMFSDFMSTHNYEFDCGVPTMNDTLDRKIFHAFVEFFTLDYTTSRDQGLNVIKLFSSIIYECW